MRSYLTQVAAVFTIALFASIAKPSHLSAQELRGSLLVDAVDSDISLFRGLDSAQNAPITCANQLRVPAGALGDFFGRGAIAGIPFAAQPGLKLSFNMSRSAP
jgi:hypothetical protein